MAKLLKEKILQTIRRNHNCSFTQTDGVNMSYVDVAVKENDATNIYRIVIVKQNDKSFCTALPQLTVSTAESVGRLMTLS